VPKIKFVDHSGHEHLVEALLGQSVMQTAVSNMVPGIVGDCGGNCACATCHVYIGGPWREHIPPANKEEREMIDCALHVEDNSRLSCQVYITPELDGLVVRIPVSQT
jgi:ferredoxin, 2Fe-2S